MFFFFCPELLYVFRDESHIFNNVLYCNLYCKYCPERVFGVRDWKAVVMISFLFIFSFVFCVFILFCLFFDAMEEERF